MANRNTDISFLDELNDAQRQAVEYIDGPSLIIAGAGSGKTRVLTYKIAYLLSIGIKPWNILALTFTNKAAREMRQRISTLVGEQKARHLFMGTFHSVFARILRREAATLGYTHDFSIYDTQDSKSLLKSVVKELGADEKIYKASEVLSRISLAKNHLISPSRYAADHDLAERDRHSRMYRMPEIYSTYQNRLLAANAMDFDDLLVNTYVLLKQHPDIAAKYQQGFRYLLVDEYQDTNHVQYMIIRLLAEPDMHISVVGDDAQSIYSFRGANIENILRFRQDFNNARLFKLEQNYRSTKNIVGAANSLIHKNQGQIHKDVFTQLATGDLLHLSSYSSDRDEASNVASVIERKRSARTSLDEIAVLYRTNAQSRTLEDELRKRGIAYRIYGGVAFYQRKEIKDALAYMRLCCNLRDEEALLRIINLPARGIGDTTMRRATEAAHAAGMSLFDVVADPAAVDLNVSQATRNKLIRFARMVLGWTDKAATLDAYSFANMVMQESQLMSSAADYTNPDDRDRYENMQELLSGIQEFCEREHQAGNEDVHIADFLSEVSLMTDQDQNLTDTEHRVTLMTVHAAKGLEFDTVFIVGMEEDLFPSPFAASLAELEEERRLFYVAITRAKNDCYISSCKSRFLRGKQQFMTESRFLRDIDPQYVRREEQQEKRHSFYSYDFDDDFSDAVSDFGYGSVPRSYPRATPSQSSTHSANTTPPANSRRIGNIGSGTSAKTAIETEFPVGARISHNTFGQGTVLATYIENDNRKIDISFDTVGKKTLLLAYAKLTLL